MNITVIQSKAAAFLNSISPKNGDIEAMLLCCSNRMQPCSLECHRDNSDSAASF